MVGIMLVAFVGMGAIAADIGRFYVVTAELQTAADAAALDGAVELMNTAGSTPQGTVAPKVVTFVSTTNKADTQGLGITGDSVLFGFWTPGTATTQGSIDYALNGRRPNAVTVGVGIAPRGVFSQFLGQTLGLPLTRRATAWVASLGSNCVRPWAFPYTPLYAAVSGVPNPPTPAPDLDPAKFSTYMAGANNTRFFTILGQNQGPSALPNDGEWTGFNFTGNAGKPGFQDGITGCWSNKINPDAGQGVTLPGQANQYVNWSLDVVYPTGSGKSAPKDTLCATYRPGNAGCYQADSSLVAGVTINAAFGDLLGNGSNGIDFRYVGQFVLVCYYKFSTDVCPMPKPGTPNTGYPPGTLVGYVQGLKSRIITPDDIVGNFASDVQRVLLVK